MSNEITGVELDRCEQELPTAREMTALVPHIKAGIDAYVRHRRPPGQFIQAVLSNDLKEAVGRADDMATVNLSLIVRYCYNCMPGNVWGSAERVAEWLAGPREDPTA